MTELGLRERKKARTRQVIADAAARLFAQRGYEQVTVSDVAREAEVSEQTVYNYFPTKDQLVTDRDQLIQDQLSRLIRTRAPGTTPAAAIREFVLDTVEGIRRIPAGQWRGELGFLAAISPTVHRLALELSDRQATALATAIAETDTVAPEIAKLRGIALAGVFQIIITEAGRRTREGQSQNQIADELRPAIEAVLDDLDAWLRLRLAWRRFAAARPQLLGDESERLDRSPRTGQDDGPFGGVHQQGRTPCGVVGCQPDPPEARGQCVARGVERRLRPVEDALLVSSGHRPGRCAAGLEVRALDHPPPDVYIPGDHIVRSLGADRIDLVLHPPPGIVDRELDQLGTAAREIVVDGAAWRSGPREHFAGGHALKSPLGVRRQQP